MIRLHTLGSLDLIDSDGRAVRSLLQQPRRVALLVYLALARSERWHRRDTLLALFWPDADAEHARGSLSQALYQLRRMLGSGVIVSRGAEMVGLADDVQCDAVELSRLLREGRAEEAVALYRGAFLEGFFISDAPEFEQWVDRERERLHVTAMEAFGAATEAAALRGDSGHATDLARRAVAAAPTDEVVLRRLLSLLIRSGDRAGAVRTYESFAARLLADYDLAPSAATRELVEAARVAEPVVKSDMTVSAFETPSILAAMAPDPPPAHAVRKNGWRAALLVFAAAVVVIGAVRARWRGTRVSIANPSVAVLPFLNLSDAVGNEYFSDGLTEQLTTALAHVSALRVAARTSAFAFRGTTESVADIGRKLNVAYVVEGSVGSDGPRLRITARLVDTHSGAPTWSSTYDRRREDIFAVQEEVVRAIVSAIEPQLVSDTMHALASTTRNVDAYNAYLKGRYHFNMRSPSHGWASVHAFEQAVALDSTFAAAWSGLADSYALLPYYRLASSREILPRALAAAHRAVALDSSLAEPHSTLGWIAFTYQWDWPTASREFQTALRLNPNYPDAIHFYGLFLSRVMGQRDAAREMAARAQRVDPLAPVMQAGAGGAYYHCRDFDASIAAYLHALAIDSTYWIARGLLAETYMAANRPADVIRELRLIPAGTRPIHGGPALMGAAFARLGMRDSAMAMLAQARADTTRPYELALLYAALGDPDDAFAALDRAVSERDPLVVSMRNEPRLDALRSDPRFDRVADRMGLPR